VLFAFSPPRKEVLPALMSILAPALRPVAHDLLTAEERRRVGGVVDSLLAYGVTFDLSTPDSSAPSFATSRPGAKPQPEEALRGRLPLQPPVDMLCAFPVRNMSSFTYVRGKNNLEAYAVRLPSALLDR
jgi:hypothetical protein